jgi:hypothetical protein
MGSDFLFPSPRAVSLHMLAQRLEKFETTFVGSTEQMYCSKLCFTKVTGLDRSLGLQEVQTRRISRQSAHAGGKVVSPTHRPPLPPRKFSWYSFLLDAESTPGP